MHVKELLEKLEIPLNILRLIGDKVNVIIKNEKQLLSPFQITKLQRFVLQDEFSVLVASLREEYNNVLQNAYKDCKFLYFVGSIKWFSDVDGNIDYGFAYINSIGDVYFKEKDIFNSSPKDFKKGELVLIRIEEKELATSEKLRASRINFVKDEDNTTFLVHLKINKLLPSSQMSLLDFMLTEKMANLDKNQRVFLGLYIDTLPSENFDINQLDFYLNLYSIVEKELLGSPFIEGLSIEKKFKLWLKDFSLISLNDIREKLVDMVSSMEEEWDSLHELNLETREELFRIAMVRLNEIDSSIKEYLTLYSNALKYGVTLSYKEVPENVLFELWTQVVFNVPVDLVKDELADKLYDPNTSLPAALRNEKKENQQVVLEYALNKLLQGPKYIEKLDYVEFKTLFSKAKNLEIHLSTEKIEDTISQLLWRDHLSDRPIIFKIYQDYWQCFSQSYSEKNNDNLQVIYIEYPHDLKRLTDDQISNLLSAHFYDLKTIEQKDYQFFKALLQLNLSDIHQSKLILSLENISDSYWKLRLFVDDCIQTIDYDEAVLYTGLLKSDEQKMFFKKCLSLVESKKAFWTIEDFNRIIATDYKLYGQAKSIGIYDLDFSLAMILHVVTKVKEGETISQQSIFEIVAKLINDPKELLKITGFFDRCHGRQSLKKINDTNPEQYELNNYKDSDPRFATYCEGRKAVDKKSGKPILCEKSKKEFYWCENSRCYDIARKAHDDNEWKNYSMIDVFRILNISFSEIQYEQLVGTINKANRFFEHLNCKDCGHILHPSGNDNYGFYRVSNFCCKNADCNNNENIYLSHCANGQCLDIVDSRDSVRCKANGSEDTCGWYVCNNCHACCTTKNIQAKAYRLAQMNQDHKCPSEGHWDQQKLCCNKCGTEMKEQNSNYDVLLKWMLDNKDTHPCITKSDVNQNGKHWFLWIQGDFSREKYRETVINFRRNGFNVPDFEDENKSSYLIAEPRYNKPIHSYYKCSKCNNELVISKDVLPPDQYSAIKKYHFERSGKESSSF